MQAAFFCFWFRALDGRESLLLGRVCWGQCRNEVFGHEHNGIQSFIQSLYGLLRMATFREDSCPIDCTLERSNRG